MPNFGAAHLTSGKQQQGDAIDNIELAIAENERRAQATVTDLRVAAQSRCALELQLREAGDRVRGD